MLSINTNLSSLIARQSMSSATNKLNQAIERMTTGYKINGAKDNAANYSISTNMTTKINSYMVAEDNVAMGLDMLSTANGSLDQISDKLTRLRALATQASNGTYGTQSLTAINSEANALVDEIKCLYNTAEYNGQSLFNELSDAGFQKDPCDFSDAEIASMTKISEVDTFVAGEFYAIMTAQDLAKLATLTNSGVDTTDVTFVLGADIDLSEYPSGEGWQPIGIKGSYFKGLFNGNGHIIKNLKQNRPNAECQGLFGVAMSDRICNLGLENVEITAQGIAGALVGQFKGKVDNCYSTGNINCSKKYVGGLIGIVVSGTIENCSSEVNVKAVNTVGGLIGQNQANITKSFSTGDVTGVTAVGGFCGVSRELITNSYALGNVVGGQVVGGFSGVILADVQNCYAAGSVISSTEDENVSCLVGGFAGYAQPKSSTEALNIINCYSTGNVEMKISTAATAWGSVGGFIGSGSMARDYSTVNIENSYALGNVHANRGNTGGFIGYVQNNTTVNIKNCYTTATVSIDDSSEIVSGFLGYAALNSVLNVSDVYILGSVKGTNTAIFSSYAPSAALTDANFTINNCYYSSNFNTNSTYFMIDYDFANPPREEILSEFIKTDSKKPFEYNKINRTLQVGIGTDNNSQIDIKIDLALNKITTLRGIGRDNNTDFINLLDTMIATVAAKQNEYGAVQNRLESALDEIAIQYDNLVSSRSTLRDADIAEVSSTYIQQQILQQASATLLATANQSPSIALQLI